jgi:predicted RNA-binding Zn-ribbon protein involved in translation (DUF1610 family)
MSTRYTDEGYPLLHWETSIEVICPKCGGVGVIDGNPTWRDWRATFLCHSCSHSMKSERDGWHGPVLCDEVGQPSPTWKVPIAQRI